MRKGIVALAISGLAVGAGIGTGPITSRAEPAQIGTAVVLTANQSICDKYCDGRDPALASGDRQALSTAIYGRSIVLHFDDPDDMAWASIDGGSAGDEVWMDRSWDGGSTWSGGAEPGGIKTPHGGTRGGCA